MNQNYTVNNELNRLEPLDKKCGFCDNGKLHNVNDCHFVSLFNEEDRTNIIVYQSVRYSKLLIGISRCPSCLGIHQSAKKIASIICWLLGGVIALTILVYTFTTPNFDFLDSFLGIMAAIIIVVIMGLLGTELLQNMLIRKKSIYTLNEGTEANEIVQDFVIAGWSLTPPKV